VHILDYFISDRFFSVLGHDVWQDICVVAGDKNYLVHIAQFSAYCSAGFD